MYAVPVPVLLKITLTGPDGTTVIGTADVLTATGTGMLITRTS